MTLDTSPKELINDFLEKQANLDTLRFITCGSVDDGKSTLIGRLLEAGSILDDQLNALGRPRRHGTQGDDRFCTRRWPRCRTRARHNIDVAYRYFSTDQRKFIIADTPGTSSIPNTKQAPQQLTLR